MNIDDHVSGIVNQILSELTVKIQQQVSDIVEQKIVDSIKLIDIESLLASRLDEKLTNRLNLLPIDQKTIQVELSNRLSEMSTGLASIVQNKALAEISNSISTQINNLDFANLATQGLMSAVKHKKFDFQPASIPGNAVDVSSLELSADNLNGGIARNFGSTGIDDKASTCQLSIFDDTTVIENNLLTKDLTVKGTATIEGDLIVTGSVPQNSEFYRKLTLDVSNTVRTNLDSTFFNNYTQSVFDIIREKGIDLSKLTVNGKVIVDGNNLSNDITYSNLQRVGHLQELQVRGETLLSESLYTTQKRVGVNTIEPSQALSVWDQEIEIGLGKRSNNVAVIETPRNQNLILSSNGKNNLILESDGSVLVNKLSIGSSVTITASDRPPADNQPKGTIVFNSNPSLGGPLGWVSLGEARWANFGIID